jgi:hypothetical protein
MRGELGLAREKLLACAQSGCPALISNDCGTWLGEVEASLPSVVLAVVDDEGRDVIEVTVSANQRTLTERIDGQALPLDPGSYELTFKAPGFAPRSIALTVRQAEKNRLVRVQLTREAPKASGGIPLASYVLGGVAIAGLGTFAFFALSGADEYDTLEDTCARSCTEAQVEDGKLAYIVADVGLGIGVASAAAAVIVYVLSQPDDEEKAPSTRIDIAPTQGGARAQWTARF